MFLANESSSLFSEKEKVALRFGMAAGSVPNAVTEEHFADLRKHFTEKQIVELGATVAFFGFLNRWNDTFGTPLEAKAIAKNSKVLVLNALRKKEHISHFTLDEALEVIEELKPERAFLTHLSHQMGRHAEVERMLPENVRIGYDGLKVEV